MLNFDSTGGLYSRRHWSSAQSPNVGDISAYAVDIDSGD